MCTQLPPYHTSRSPQGRGFVATLRNRRPLARFAFGCMVGCGVAFVRRYLVPGVFYLATFANLVAERTTVRPNSGFCAAAVYLRQPFNITSASYHQALEHCQAQKPLNTIIIQFPLHTKYIILPLKCAPFNLSKNSGHKKANFRLINKYSNFPHFTFIVQRISFDFLQTLL